MAEFKIKKFPVIILGNFRTGSTILAKKIGRFYNLMIFDEPHKENPGLLYKNFIENNNKKIVVKINGSQVYDDLLYHQLLSNKDSFKIKLSRKDKIDQVASLYIAKENGIWHQTRHDYEMTKDYVVDIKTDKIRDTIQSLIKEDSIIKNVEYEFDLELHYEDLIFNEDLPFTKIKPPKNKIELTNTIRQIMEREKINFVDNTHRDAII